MATCISGQAQAGPQPAVEVMTGCVAPPLPWEFPARGRTVALGDVHGDMAAAKRALRAARVIDEKDRWIGGKATLVQVGDILDRGGNERDIVGLFDRLGKEARAAGGRVVVLNGNHELMNVAGDFRYVTEEGWRDFSSTPIPPGIGTALSSIPRDKRGRIVAFAPGGSYAVRYAMQPLIAKVGDTLFAHGGVLPEHLDRVEQMHRKTQCWLLGQGPPPLEVLEAGSSPVWTRLLAAQPAPCGMVDEVLRGMKAKRLVIGHTVQEGGMRSECKGKLWMVDVGMSAHYGGRPEALVIDARGNVSRAR